VSASAQNRQDTLSLTEFDMSRLISKYAPSSKSIRKEYVEKRQRELFKNSDTKTTAVKDSVEQLMEKYGIQVTQGQGLTDGNWYPIFLKIADVLRASPLTINMDSRAWFSSRNTRGTYNQMYENNVQADRSVLLKKNLENDPIARSYADDKVTLPEDWATAKKGSQRRRLYDALNFTGITDATLVDAGKSTLIQGKDQDGANTAQTTNPKFKAKAKQVFAALNFAHRPHGSTVKYGFSHLVLQEKLKEKALYFGGDTFYVAGTRNPMAAQATFQTIGAILGSPNQDLVKELFECCCLRKRLDDTSNDYLIVEAHIFKKVKMTAEHVRELVLSRQHLQKDTAGPISEQEWETIKANATEWCSRNGGITLTFASP
jgi:hypothetical protein